MANSYTTSKLETRAMGQAVDSMMKSAREARHNFERRWYDNNFFDDGHHFRFLSRTENKIIDLSKRSRVGAPMRAIPKASRQIRGVANLLTSGDPVPVVFPEKIEEGNYEDPRMYELARQEAKRVAKLTGHWIEEEFKEHWIDQKLAQMAILTAKHGISFMQVWPDAVDESIKTRVYDAFDIHLLGDLTEIEDCPYVIKAIPMFASQIKANEMFDKEQRDKITPDNRQASSEIKEAYMLARYGREFKTDETATLILKEAYIKEFLNKDNSARIRKQKDGKDILGDLKEGDPVYRQVFVAGNFWLYDKYTTLRSYPFVDLRFEPGPLYHTPMIERFIPTNKSLDTVVSRVEGITNTMAVGVWLKRQGEQVNISNHQGGQIVEYKSVPPQQAQMAGIPNHVFGYIDLLNSFIEEQGVTTTTLGKIPRGVKAASAIESLKESEFANLVIARKQLVKTVEQIAHRFLDLADDHFVTPQTFVFLDKGEPQYVDVVGKSAMDKREDLKVPVGNGVVPLSKDYKVDIEIQTGAAFTREGARQAMQQVIQEMRAYAAEGYIPPDALALVIEKYLESYQFGATGEFMEELEKAGGFGGLTEQQLQAIKVAVAEVMKDLDIAGGSKQRIEETKVGAAEAIRDSGAGQEEQEKPPSRSVKMDDLPPEGKAQLAQQAGVAVSPASFAEKERRENASEEKKAASKPKNK
jgi:hypothetical protein